jgi:hypothetical protein
MEILDLVRIDRFAKRGENRPVFATCENQAGEFIEVVLKPSGLVSMGIKALAVEWTLANLGGDLSLRVCEPFLVKLNKTIIDEVSDADWSARALAGNQIAFGSRVAGSNDGTLGIDQWSSAYAPVGPMLDQAWHTAAFDVWTDNIDRHPGNANCLVRGRDFWLIDHEKCFTTLSGIPIFGIKQLKPWEPGGASHILTPQKHIFAQQLKGKKMPRAAIKDAWLDLSATHLQHYGDNLPPEWVDAKPIVEKIVSALNDIQTNIDDCLNELERCLS